MANDSASAQIRVRILSDQDHKQVVVKASIFMIGRDSECAIQIADLNVSRKQLEVSLIDGQVNVMDAGSSNGCFINGVRMPKGQKVVLAKSDRLTFGGTNLALFITADDGSAVRSGTSTSAPSKDVPVAPKTASIDIQELLNRALGKTAAKEEPAKMAEPVKEVAKAAEPVKVEVVKEEASVVKAEAEVLKLQAKEQSANIIKQAQELAHKLVAEAKAMETQVLNQLKAKETQAAHEFKAREAELAKELKAKEEQSLAHLRKQESQLLNEAKAKSEQLLNEAKSQSTFLLTEVKKREAQFLEEMESRARQIEEDARNNAAQLVQAAERARDEQLGEIAEQRAQIIHDAQERASRVDAEIKDRLELVSKELQKIQSEHEDLRESVADLKKEKAKVEREAEALLKVQVNVRDELEANREKIETLAEQASQARKDLEQQRKELEKLAQEKADLLDMVEKHEVKKETLANDLAELLKAKDSVEQSRAKLSAEIQEFEVKKKDAEQSLAAVMLIISSFEKTRDDLAQENEKNKNEISTKVKSQKEEMERSLQVEMLKLQDQLKKVKEQVAEEEARLEKLRKEQPVSAPTPQVQAKMESKTIEFNKPVETKPAIPLVEAKPAIPQVKPAAPGLDEVLPPIPGGGDMLPLPIPTPMTAKVEIKSDVKVEAKPEVKVEPKPMIPEIKPEKTDPKIQLDKLEKTDPKILLEEKKKVDVTPPSVKPVDPMLPEMPKAPAKVATPASTIAVDEEEEMLDEDGETMPYLASLTSRRNKVRAFTAGATLVLIIGVGAVLSKSFHERDAAQQDLASAIGAPEEARVAPPAPPPPPPAQPVTRPAPPTAPAPAPAAPVARVEAKKKGMPFKPEQSNDVKDSYTNSVIYTRDYEQVFLSDEAQRRWLSNMNEFSKKWGVKRESAAEASALSKRLVGELRGLKSKMDTENIQSVVSAMKDAESATVNRMIQLLGSRSKFDQFKNEEKKFFARELSRKGKSRTAGRNDLFED